ncbi:MAG: peptidoglycan DD-metalloendopeptidase family protein [Candidatus Omnitrophica bacterium]|nr:peptidoglycan DD-metalloendopeptidase family protein [Candidatus Omnitrophota bacterium]
MMMANRKFFILVLVMVAPLSGCRTTQPAPPTLVLPPPNLKPEGIYHKVNKKETIWRIAKAYNVTIDEIVRSNNIPNIAEIEVNQLVFIPGADAVKEIYIDDEETKDDFVWPLRGQVIHYFHQKRKDGIASPGIDIKAQRGEVVRAARSGKVVLADYIPGQAYTVVIDHQDGFYSVYAKNAEVLVKLGDYVFKHDPIARVGEHDRLAYLHFQIRKNDKGDNPLYYLP